MDFRVGRGRWGEGVWGDFVFADGLVIAVRIHFTLARFASIRIS